MRAVSILCRAVTVRERAAAIRQRALSALSRSKCVGKRKATAPLQATVAFQLDVISFATIFAILAGVYYFPALPMSASARLVAARSAFGPTSAQ